MRKKYVYVVRGETGEHADWSSWVVCGFTRLKEAKKYVKDANTAATEIYVSLMGKMYWAKDHGKNPFDPDMKMDYTGTTYTYAKVPFYESKP